MRQQLSQNPALEKNICPALRHRAVSHVGFAVGAQQWCFFAVAVFARAPNGPRPPRILSVLPVVGIGHRVQGGARWQRRWVIARVNLPEPAANRCFLSQFLFGEVARLFFVKTLRGEVL